ncbi:MAG: hypothetical protein KDB03_18335 [Planctomycetales bacterium]|nr:hypothetical protein [Planctomycetales bacterium]
MELASCLIGGCALITFGLGLGRIAPPQWHADNMSDEDLKKLASWASIQKWVRKINNMLFVIMGVAIGASPFVPKGRPWMLLWCVVLLMLLLCILLAMLDAFSSLAGYRRALPDAARKSLGLQSGAMESKL